MRLVVEVPDEQLNRFKVAVAREHRTQADVIRAAIDSYIKNIEKQSGTKRERTEQSDD